MKETIYNFLEKFFLIVWFAMLFFVWSWMWVACYKSWGSIKSGITMECTYNNN